MARPAACTAARYLIRQLEPSRGEPGEAQNATPLETYYTHAQVSSEVLQGGKSDEAFHRNACHGGRGIDTGHGIWATAPAVRTNK